MFTLSQLCVRDTGHLLNAFQKAYSARLTTGLPGRRCLWTSHWVSQPFTLWIKQSYSDVKLSVRICITVCFTHCVITSRWSAGTGKGSLTAEDVIYLFHGRSKKMWSVQQTNEVVCLNNMWHPYGYTANGRTKKSLKYSYYLISMKSFHSRTHTSTAECVNLQCFIVFYICYPVKV